MPARMVTLNTSSVEARVVEFLLEVYQVTFEELCEEFNLAPKRLERVLRGLEKRGLVVIEAHPELTYIRLRHRRIRFVGRRRGRKRSRSSQRSEQQAQSQTQDRSSEPRPAEREYDGFMYQ